MQAMGGVALNTTPSPKTAHRETETGKRSRNNSRGPGGSRQSSRSADRNRNQEKEEKLPSHPMQEFLDQATEKEILNNTVLFEAV